MRIIHPRPSAGRQRFIGVEFRDGVAEAESLHPEVEASLLQHGYTIERFELQLLTKENLPDGAPDETWTVGQLVAFATIAGVELIGPYEKAAILAALDAPDASAEKTSRRRTRGKADPLTPANFTLDGAEFAAPDSVPLTLADLRLTAEVDEAHDVWLADGALDTKIEADWLPVDGAVLRTAPTIINGG